LLKLVLLLVPLAFDTFAVSAALGLGRPSKKERLRISLTFSVFEMVMPIVGLAAGRALGSAIGTIADYLAFGLLGLLGLWMLFEEDGVEHGRAELLGRARGLALIALGVSVSLDELAIGFVIGLLHTPIWFAIAFIGAQAFLVAQLGLRVGAHFGQALRANAERAAGVALIVLGAVFLVQKVA
jgi:putative Mn2+ efflux pump MntP